MSFDRAGYGQSDPNPKRSIKSDVEDVEDVADGLKLRPKFYVIATSIGGYTGWGLLKYKPERLAGIALSAPVVNFWWPGLPKSELTKAWDTQRIGDKMSLSITHYLPSLTYWYNMQKLFPTATVSSGDGITAFNDKDQEIMKMLPKIVSPEVYAMLFSIRGVASSFSWLYTLFSSVHFEKIPQQIVEKLSLVLSLFKYLHYLSDYWINFPDN